MNNKSTWNFLKNNNNTKITIKQALVLVELDKLSIQLGSFAYELYLISSESYFHDSSVKREQMNLQQNTRVIMFMSWLCLMIFTCVLWPCVTTGARLESQKWSEACCLRGRRAPQRRNLITAGGPVGSGVWLQATAPCFLQTSPLSSSWRSN